MKFNIVNKGKSNAYGTVRLTKEQFREVQRFMHSTDVDVVEFPRGVTLVHQGRGHYRLWSATSDEKPTAALILAIRLSSKALHEYLDFRRRIRTERPLAYTDGAFINTRLTKNPCRSAMVEEIAMLLKRKFRVKTNVPQRVAYA